jgi:hypothetical protein
VQGHGEQSAQTVNAIVVQGATWVHPARQGLHGLHTASAALPQARSAYWVALHTVHGEHTGLQGLMQGAEWYVPAGQLLHGRQSRSLSGVHTRHMKKPGGQTVRQLGHTVSAVAVQARDWYVSLGHAVQLAQ